MTLVSRKPSPIRSLPVGGFRENKLSISAATVGGATLFGLVEYFEHGHATINWKKTLTYAALGGLAGFTSSVAVTQSSDWAKKTNEANWAVIGGSIGVAIPLIYSVYAKQAKNRVYSNQQLMNNAVIGALIGGALGTAATYGQKTGLFFGRRTQFA